MTKFYNNTWNANNHGPDSTEFINYLYGAQFMIGIILNPLTILICCRKPLRKTPSFVVTAFIALLNTVLLITTALPSFIGHFLTYSLNSNLAWCKLSLYFGIVTSNWIAWLLVSLNLYLRYWYWFNGYSIYRSSSLSIFTLAPILNFKNFPLFGFFYQQLL